MVAGALNRLARLAKHPYLKDTLSGCDGPEFFCISARPWDWVLFRA
jgi:hypothetical protein